MGGLSDILGFEKFQLQDFGRQARGNKSNTLMQLLLGAADPIGAKLWGKILGKDFTPFVNEFGGPTEERFAAADEAGVDTGLSRGSHAVAKQIAAIYAGNALGGIGGGGAAAEVPGAAASGQALGSTAGTGAGATLGNTPALLSGSSFPTQLGGFTVPTTTAVPLGSVAGGIGGGAANSLGQVTSQPSIFNPGAQRVVPQGGSSGNSFQDQLQDQLQQQQPGSQEQGGGGANPELVALMLELQRQAEERRKKAEEEERERQAGFRRQSHTAFSRRF